MIGQHELISLGSYFLVGYCTNWVAIKLLFYPKRAVYLFGRFKVPLTPGVFPRRKEEIARSISKMIVDLLPLDSLIKDTLTNGEKMAQVIAILESNIFNKIPLSKLIPGQLKLVLFVHVARAILRSGVQISDTINLPDQIYKKIMSYSDERMEELLLGVVGRHLKTLTLLGGYLGLLIGASKMFIGDMF